MELWDGEQVILTCERLWKEMVIKVGKTYDGMDDLHVGMGTESAFLHTMAHNATLFVLVWVKRDVALCA